MKRIIFIALILLGIVAPATYAQISKKKVAVYMTGEIEESYKKVIGAKLVSAITATDEYAAVERTADFLAALASEQDYQISGEVRDSQIASIGQRFGVLYVVVADVNELFGEIFIAARLINVETGLVEKAADASAAAESMSQLVELSTQVSNKLLLGSAVAVSAKPIHLSLCASKEGKIFYITQEKWGKMDDATKSSYQKIGICLIDDNRKGIFKGTGRGLSFRTLISTTCPDYVADHGWTMFIESNRQLIDSSTNAFGYNYRLTDISSPLVYKGLVHYAETASNGYIYNFPIIRGSGNYHKVYVSITEDPYLKFSEAGSGYSYYIVTPISE